MKSDNEIGDSVDWAAAKAAVQRRKEQAPKKPVKEIKDDLASVRGKPFQMQHPGAAVIFAAARKNAQDLLERCAYFRYKEGDSEAMEKAQYHAKMVEEIYAHAQRMVDALPHWEGSPVAYAPLPPLPPKPQVNVEQNSDNSLLAFGVGAALGVGLSD